MNHDHDHDDEIALRVEALEALLVEKGLVDPAVVDEIIRHYEEDVGPMNGARVVARAWTDPAYKARLLADGTAAVAEMGFAGREASHVRVVENEPGVHNVVVCSLCSCYPWGLLGLPPAWYKSPAYRSRVVREPRATPAYDPVTVTARPPVTTRRPGLAVAGDWTTSPLPATIEAAVLSGRKAAAVLMARHSAARHSAGRTAHA